ncbi:hypothetical protein BLA29_010598, partial [Euroglyphus maynei]
MYEKQHHRKQPPFALKLRNKLSSSTMMTTTTTMTNSDKSTNYDDLFHYRAINDQQSNQNDFMLADSPQIDQYDDDDIENDYFPSSSKNQRTRITRHRHKNSEKDF